MYTQVTAASDWPCLFCILSVLFSISYSWFGLQLLSYIWSSFSYSSFGIAAVILSLSLDCLVT